MDGEERFRVGQDPGGELLEVLLAEGASASKNLVFFLARPQISRQNVQIFTKVYKFLAKLRQFTPIPPHGEEKVILIPRRG